MKEKIGIQNPNQVLMTPMHISARWFMHVESVRRKIRAGSIPSLVIGRRRLVRLTDVEKIESDAEATVKN